MLKKLTLAQFKRDASSGHMGLELIERYGKKIDDSVVVPVIKVQTNGICLKRGNAESFLDIPYASLIEYTGDMLRVYDKGQRPLNETEQIVMNKWKAIENTPEFKQRAYVDAVSDGGYTYYQQKQFFEESPCPYLFTGKNRLSLDFNTGKVIDPRVRGKCVLVYKVHKI